MADGDIGRDDRSSTSSLTVSNYIHRQKRMRMYVYVCVDVLRHLPFSDTIDLVDVILLTEVKIVQIFLLIDQ